MPESESVPMTRPLSRNLVNSSQLVSGSSARTLRLAKWDENKVASLGRWDAGAEVTA